MTAQAGAVAALRPDEVELIMWPEKRGGMKVGMESGVIVHHRESGLAVGCRSERSQHKNRDIALARLNAMLGMSPAAVPVEALEELVDELDQLAADIARAGIAGFGNRALAIRHELTQLIKERSNG